MKLKIIICKPFIEHLIMHKRPSLTCSCAYGLTEKVQTNRHFYFRFLILDFVPMGPNEQENQN